MENKKTRTSGTGAHAAGARHAARPANGGATRQARGSSQAAGASRVRSTSASGGARTARSGAHAAQAKSGAHAAKRGGATGGRRPQGKRRSGVRLDIRDKKLWLIIGACVLVIIVAVVLALTLPMGDKKDEVVPASAVVEDGGASADGLEADDAGDASESMGDEAGEDPLENVPVVDATDEDLSVEDAADEGASGEADAAADASGAQLDSDTSEMLEKYKVLNGIPNTEEPLGLPETERVEDSYFDGALFVGDSVTLKLQRYVTSTRKVETPNLLGTARFLSAQSFSARNALRDITEKSIHPVIEGVKMTLEDAIAKFAPTKLYLMLGMNDVGVSGIDGALENMGKLLKRIREKNPDLLIIVESATPRLKGTHPTTNQLFIFDVRLYDAILKMGDPKIQFLDVAFAMRDSEGKLVAEYCDDPNNMAIHFTNAGCRQWIDFLYTHPAT